MPDSAIVWTLPPQRLNRERLFRTCLAWLDAQELQQIHSLANDELRHNYLAAHALCRAALASTTGDAPAELRFERDEAGKPRLATAASCQFNLTHTEGLAAVVVSSGGRVGIDAEWIVRPIDLDQVARHFLSASARQALNDQPETLRMIWFYERWVLQEAKLKADGQGITDEFHVDAPSMNSSARSFVLPPWRVELFSPTPSHRLAVAVQAEPHTPIEFRRGEELFEAGIAVVE